MFDHPGAPSLYWHLWYIARLILKAINKKSSKSVLAQSRFFQWILLPFFDPFSMAKIAEIMVLD